MAGMGKEDWDGWTGKMYSNPSLPENTFSVEKHFQLKMQHKAVGGRAPPGPAGDA
jgi:hypothetical protein